MVALPVFSAVLVCGPPASPWKNGPKAILYVLSRPGWQNGRCGHSAGPARMLAAPLHLAAKSDSVLSWYLSATGLVTANAFWSEAGDGAPTVRLYWVASGLRAATVAVMSPLA